MFHLITGGSGSGKSAFAEATICQYHTVLVQKNPEVKLYYIATMIPYGKETQKKIDRHREMRKNKGFSTIECYADLPAVLEKQGVFESPCCVLLECMSNLVANELYEPRGAGKDTVLKVLEGIRSLHKSCCHLVVVTNEVGSDSALDSLEMQGYKQTLGKINCQMAVQADQVTEVIYGLPVSIKEKRDMCKEDNNHVTKTIKIIIGGAHQGKQEFAENKYGNIQWIDARDCSLESLYTCQGILHFEIYIRRMLEEGRDTSQLTRGIVRQNPEIIIVSQEVGYGLVPIDAFERKYREQVGRICTELTAQGAEVNRVVCGIGISLKGE